MLLVRTPRRNFWITLWVAHAADIARHPFLMNVNCLKDKRYPRVCPKHRTSVLRHIAAPMYIAGTRNQTTAPESDDGVCNQFQCLVWRIIQDVYSPCCSVYQCVRSSTNATSLVTMDPLPSPREPYFAHSLLRVLFGCGIVSQKIWIGLNKIITSILR